MNPRGRVIRETWDWCTVVAGRKHVKNVQIPGELAQTGQRHHSLFSGYEGKHTQCNGYMDKIL